MCLVHKRKGQANCESCLLQFSIHQIARSGSDLPNKKILIFIDHIYEDMELMYPKYRLIEEGVGVKVRGSEYL